MTTTLDARLARSTRTLQHLVSLDGTWRPSVPGARGAVCGPSAVELPGSVVVQPFISDHHPKCLLVVLDVADDDPWESALYVDRAGQDALVHRSLRSGQTGLEVRLVAQDAGYASLFIGTALAYTLYDWLVVDDRLPVHVTSSHARVHVAP